MKEVLVPLARIPGIRVAMLCSEDGVPIAVRGRISREQDAGGNSPAFGDSAEDLNALAALAAGWIGELTRSIAPLSWESPRRVALTATRGTMIVLHGPGAFLLVLLESGVHPEELRLPMEAAINRMQRVLRGMGRDSVPGSAEEEHEPSGIFPGGRELRLATGPAGDPTTTGNQVPEISGEV